jgi:hypothetical protein
LSVISEVTHFSRAYSQPVRKGNSGLGSRDRAARPGWCKTFLLFGGAREWIFAAPGCTDVSVRKKAASWLRFQQFVSPTWPGRDRKKSAQLLMQLGCEFR